MARIRRIAVLVDGGFFLKRLRRLVPEQHRESPAAVADTVRLLAKRHVTKLAHLGQRGREDQHWLDHTYRVFFYDGKPYTDIAHHPFLNKQIKFADTKEAQFRNEIFAELTRKRKFAVRLGNTRKVGEWSLKAKLTKPLLRTRGSANIIRGLLSGAITPEALTPEQKQQLELLVAFWDDFQEHDVSLTLRQKGVDMRIGTDISSLTLKRQVDTIVLVTGDEDFVPAAKLARREGVEFILDRLWQNVSQGLSEHIDGLQSVLGGRSDETTPEARID